MTHDQMAIEEEFARKPLRRRTLRRLLGYMRPHRRMIALTLSLEVVWVVSMLVDVRFLRVANAVPDGPVTSGDVPATWVLVGWMALNIVTRACLTTWELGMSTRVGIEVVHRMRQDVFDHVQRLSMRYFDRTKQGRIIARADRDVDTIEQLVMWGPIVLVSLLFSIVLALVMIAFTNVPLAFLLLPAVPIVWLLSLSLQRLVFPHYRRQREAQSHISAHVAETITGVRVVKAFTAEGRERERLDALHAEYRSAVLDGARVAGLYLPSVSTVMRGSLVAGLIVGAYPVIAGSSPAEALLEFAYLVGFVLGPVEGLGSLYNDSLYAGAAAERIFLLLDTEPEVKDKEDAIDPGRLRGAVEFEDVSFAYDPSGEKGRQLHDVSFAVQPGETVALVGPTGAGKTSITNLVARFYEAQQGTVRIDGHDVRDIGLEALHRQMGIVLQESFLFAGTVLENLRFVRRELTEEEARAAFAELGCEEVLARFADGVLTDVGERGANLSEGERQIVCFVRALLGNPSILILDEATSAVDTRTERLILRALHRLSERQTTFVIAHRLSTIRDADRILVVKDGRIVEQATHDELIERGGAYAELYAEYAA